MAEIGQISRRDFLKMTSTALGALVIPLPNKPQTETGISREKKFTDETLMVGNLELTPFITEHDKTTWEKDGSEILNQLREYPLIIPEYFPPDYEPHLKENSLINRTIKHWNYSESNFAFTKISDFSQSQNKPVWVVDPAYSEAFIKLRAARNWWTPVAGAAASSPFATMAVKAVDRLPSDPNDAAIKTIKSVAKTAIASATTIGGLGSGAMVMATEKDPSGIEMDIRHVFIAESLVQLGEKIQNPTKAAIIYPAGHWYGEPENNTKGILHYIRNSNDRNKQFKRYSEKLSNQTAYEDFYKIRNYVPEGNGWSQKASIDLTVPD